METEIEKTIDLLLEFDWDLHKHAQLLHDANHGHGVRVAIWLEYGVDPNSTDESGQSALHYLAMRGTGREAIRSLAAAGADLNMRSTAGHTPLALASLAQRQTAAQTLTELGAKR